MSLEETLAALLDARLAPMRRAVEELRAEVARLRGSMPPTLVTVPEAAKALGVSQATIRRRMKDGTLPSRRVGRLRRIDLSAYRPSDPETPCLPQVMPRH